jgi:hypothetical protein
LPLNDLRNVGAAPVVLDHQILVDRQRMKPPADAFDEILRWSASRGLANDGIGHRQKVFRTVIELAQQQRLWSLAPASIR